MKKFIAYFDYLGYKEFILNNESSHLKTRANNLLRDIEDALGQGKYTSPMRGIAVPDLSTCRINCLNISDTIIFWTNDDSIESLEELLLITHRFNWREILYFFPVRGVIYCDEIEMLTGKQKNQVGAVYSSNLIYGKGLVKAHLKCENLNWAGSVIDQTVIDQIDGKVSDIEAFLAQFAKLYKVPYKDAPKGLHEEYVLKLNKSVLNEEGFKNVKDGIISAFKLDHKPIDHPRVKELIENTITYLETFRD